MTDLVPREQIETIVGSPRQHFRHMARAVSQERTVYILHSFECLESGIDLRECDYSVALDRGIDEACWPQDHCVEALITIDGRLVATQMLRALCENPLCCSECNIDIGCQREALHKGFHTAGTHKWDEYGDVEHI